MGRVRLPITARRGRDVLGAILLTGLTAAAAFAQPASDPVDPWGGVEEMLVVGSGTAVLVAETTDSVIAFDSEEIVAKGFSDISDLSSFTPNLEIKAAFAGTNPTLFIRGVGLNDYLSNAQSSVAVYNDGVYMQSPTGQLFQLFDTGGIEVLRGPQGTVYGRNATAGAILVSARKPSGEFGGYSRTTYGRFNQIEQEAALEFPVFSDVLSGRISGRLNRRDGITRNRCATPDVFDLSLPFPNQERVARDACVQSADESVDDLEKRVNDIDNWAVRGLLQYQGDGSEWLLNLHGGRTQALATHFQKIGRNPRLNANPPGFVDSQQYLDIDNPFPTFDPTDGDPYAGDFNRTGKDEVDLFGATLTGRVDFENWSLLSISALEMNERDAKTDTDAGPNRSGFGFPGAEVDFKNESTQLSQELRGEWSTPDEIVTIVGGGMVLYENLDADNRFRLLYTSNSVDGRTQEIEQETLSWGVYADLSWEPYETLEIAGGARYNWDRKDFRLRSCGFEQPFRTPGAFQLFCDPGSTFLVEGSDEETWKAFTGEASATYSPTESISFYLKYAHGWKPGQFNGSKFAAQITNPQLPPDDPLIPRLLDPPDPEEVDAFELGFKAGLFDDRVSLSGAAFIYRYKDLQVFRLRDQAGSPPVNELINAQDAQVAGVEFEFEIELMEGLYLNGMGGWLHSAYNRFKQNQTRSSFNGAQVITTTSTQDYSGSRLIASPEFTFSGTLRYDVVLERFGTLKPRLDFTWRSEIYFDPNEGRGYFERSGEFLPRGTLGDDELPLLHLQLGYATPDEQIELVGWVRNLTDEEYKIDGFDVSNGFQSLLFVIGQPRTYGLTLMVNF